MLLAIFGIDNITINLVITLVILSLVALWLALIVFTFTDARRRIEDSFLVGCATAASFFPYIGTIVYVTLRPPEFLEDVREREMELKTSEAELRHLEANSCHKCGHPSEPDFLRCPSCRTRLREKCPSCSKPVGLDWKLCPYCETVLVAPPKRSRSGSSRKEGSSSRRSSRSSREEGSRPSRKKTTTADASTGRSSSSRREKDPSARSVESGTPEERRPRRQEETGPDKAETRVDSDERNEPRPGSRKTKTPDDDPKSRPINSGDSPAQSRTPESR